MIFASFVVSSRWSMSCATQTCRTHAYAEQFGDLPCRCIAEADLNDLRGMTTNHGSGKKVVVLRDYDEPFVSRHLPDSLVIVAGETPAGCRRP
jgi:hypothetical protein